MALLELTDKCLSENDPHADLYDELFNALYTIDNNKNNDNLIYWYYQYQILNNIHLASFQTNSP